MNSNLDYRANPPVTLTCPIHGAELAVTDGRDKYVCSIQKCEYPIRNGIPRFVSPDNYANSFGLQWNRFRRTQLDSYTGTHLSRTRLTRLLGGSLNILAGKTVLEAGCGAGRFTEILLESGAHVFATDLSTAVEANSLNCGSHPRYFVCQADLLRLPVRPEQFDIVICAGVVQHTPVPEETMTTLCSHVRPGGVLAIDHYGEDYPATPSRRLVRSFLLNRSPAFSMRFCQRLCGILWPLHRMAHRAWHVRYIWRLSAAFCWLSPVVDYHRIHPELGPERLYEWAVLDTHDTLTDRYKHFRNPDQIRRHLEACGMEKVESYAGGNGVEARAWKPTITNRKPCVES